MNISIIKLFSFLLISTTYSPLFSQGVIKDVQNKKHLNPINNYCGSHDFIRSLDSKNKGFIELSDQLLLKVNNIISSQKNYPKSTSTNVYKIPIVFHVVYNNNSENIPDSVIYSQVDLLNACFRRKNTDTVDTRTEFLSLVGDTKIEFILPEIDPNGNPSNGITRTPTDIENFGGILPYNSSQTQEIIDWLNDSLFYNFFRLTKDSLGGINAWDPSEYLNVWIGDLRIYEPYFNNFEELVYFALASPPYDTTTWSMSTLELMAEFEEGVLVHYISIGPNNPTNFPPPYSNYNGIANTGKTLVHEAGHFLGLRHIWGDGNCNYDDFIDDTPLASNSSQFTCNHFKNSCVDTINGQNLPDMVENYMDYSTGDCQNSFTIGQKNLMRSEIENFRLDILDTVFVSPPIFENNVTLYPNPTNSNTTIAFDSTYNNIEISLFDIQGKLINSIQYVDAQNIVIDGTLNNGIYLIEVIFDDKRSTLKLVKY